MATEDAEAKATGGGDGGRWQWRREEATAMEGDRRRATRETTNDGRRGRATTKTTMATDERKQRRSGRAKAKMVGRCLSLLSVRAMGEEWKGKGEDGRSLSGLLPVRAMGEELRGARRVRHQKVSEFRILKFELAERDFDSRYRV